MITEQHLERRERLFYTLNDLATLWALPPSSARVRASRETSKGRLIRIRRDLYVPAERFRNNTQEELFSLANIVQTPSYVSFASALAYHALTTQVIRSVVESANPVRSRRFNADPFSFHFFYCRKEIFSGFFREKGFFVAEPEKALLDALYFQSLGRYALDQSALEARKIDWKKCGKWLPVYPARFCTYFKEWRSRWKT